MASSATSIDLRDRELLVTAWCSSWKSGPRNFRYSGRACLLLAGFGHNRPVIFSRQRSFKRRFRSETCLMSYFRASAGAAVSHGGAEAPLMASCGYIVDITLPASSGRMRLTCNWHTGIRRFRSTGPPRRLTLRQSDARQTVLAGSLRSPVTLNVPVIIESYAQFQKLEGKNTSHDSHR